MFTLFELMSSPNLREEARLKPRADKSVAYFVTCIYATATATPLVSRLYSKGSELRARQDTAFYLFTMLPCLLITAKRYTEFDSVTGREWTETLPLV